VSAAGGRGRRARGQTLVEFAFVVPFLLLSFFMVIEIGRLIYAWETVGNAAREAGRVAVVNQDPATIQQKAADMAVGLDVVAPAPNPETGVPDVTVTYPDCTSGSLGIGCFVQVDVAARFQLITPIGPLMASICQLFGQCTDEPTASFWLNTTTRMPVEFVCPNATITSASLCPRPPGQ
jgi:hypothetical protein